MSIINFDSTNVPQNDAFDPLPAGWYPVKIIASENKPTADGQGMFLALTHEILDGQFRGRKVFDRLNLQNANPMAVEIAYKTLSSICHATGVIHVRDSQELHGIPMMAKVSVRAATVGKDGKSYDASNEVKGYKKYENSGPAMGTGLPTPAFTAPTAGPVSHPAAAPTGAPTAPWATVTVQAPAGATPQGPPAWSPPVAVQQTPPVQVAQEAPPAWTPPAATAPPAEPTVTAPPAQTQAAPSAVPPWARPAGT